MEKTQKAMFSLLRCALQQKDLSNEEREHITEDMLEPLYRLSKAHDLAHIVGTELRKNQLLPSEHPLNGKFQKQELLSVFRYERMNYELEQMRGAFSEAKIPFMPLKGSVIRQYYPNPAMRTSCDIDVLVRQEDIQEATQVLEKNLRYKKEDTGLHDISFFSESGVHVELHFTLSEADVKSDRVLQEVWSYSFGKEDCPCHYCMSNEMFCTYLIAHTAKHFLHGGCGVRPLMDLWIIQNRMKCDEKILSDLLEACGLMTFYVHAVQLCEVWFSDGKPNDVIENMQDYILKAGVYGNAENRLAVSHTRKGGKARYILSRIFPPAEHLKYRYPKLSKYPFLLPWYQVCRWFRLLFPKRTKRAVNDLKIGNQITEEKKKSVVRLMDELGIR